MPYATANAAQFRAARALLHWTKAEVAEKAGLHRNTVARIESGQLVETAACQGLRRALEDGGVEFLARNGDGPGVRFRRREKKS